MKLTDRIKSFFAAPAPAPTQQTPRRVTLADAMSVQHVREWDKPLNPQASATKNVGNRNTFGYDTRRAGGKSMGGLSKYYQYLILDHYALRLNARYMLHDSKEARMVHKRYVDTVVCNGFRINPSPDAEILGISAEDAERWGKDVKNRFDLWARSKDSDITGTNTLYQNMRFYQWQYSRDGDAYIRINYSDNPDLISPVQIGFVDPNQIRGDEFTFNTGPEAQDDGIIKDNQGREIGYKVWIQDPKNKNRYKSVEIPVSDPETGRRIMLHGYNPEYAGQSRGMPELSHALQDFQDITSYSSATTKKMVQESSMGFVIENDIQDPSDMGFQSLDSSTNAGPTTIEESPSTAPTVPTPVGVDAVRYNEINEATQVETGPIFVLGAAQGDKLKPIDSKGPGERSGEFMDGQLKVLSASRGMPYSVASMKFDKSHSALRGELGLFTDTKEIEKDDVVSDAWGPIYEAWLSEEIAAGRVRAPGWTDPILKAAWLRASWSSTRVPDVDPEKTMRALTLALKLGLTDLDTESANYNNSDGPTNRSKLARQFQELIWNPFDEDLPPIGEEPDEENEEAE